MSIHRLLLKAKESGVTLFLKQGQLAFRARKDAMTRELRGEIERNKKDLIGFLSNLNAEHPKIKPLGLKRGPLSFAQSRLWLIQQLNPDSHQYNMPMVLQLEGSLNTEALQHSFSSIVDRHQILRTVICCFDSEEPLQIVQPADDFDIEYIELFKDASSSFEENLSFYINQEATRPFVLDEDLMLRVKLLRCSEELHVLLITMHHIASDGWSQGVLVNEFEALYSAFTQGQDNPLPELAIQYADYAHWQREWLQGEVLESHIDYWKGCLLGLPEVHNLPLDYARAEVQDHRGGVYRQDLGVEIQQGLNELAQRHGATLFMVLHAAFTVLLSRHSGEDDIVMGTPVANRDQAELSPLVGFFVNTLVLRLDVSDNPSFEELLIRGKDYLLGAYDHQQLPFERLVDELSPERSLSYSPLFQVMLTLQNNERRDLSLPGLRISGMGESHAVSKYDLSLTVVEGEEGLHVSWIYAEGLFKGSTIERMGCRFKELLVGVLSDPGRRIGELEVLPGWERERLLLEWNDTGVAYPEDVLIHELFEDQVELRGEAVALVCGEESLSYRELNERSNGLARYLRELGVGLESLVGLCVERSVEMVVGVLGILKAGGAYVPIDPGYPGSRQSYMVSDTGIDLLLTQRGLRGLRGLLGDFAGVEVVDLDGEWLGGCVENLGRLAGQGSSNLAYVMYTSGSTGKPKGVMVEHKGLVNLAHSLDALEMSEKDTPWGWVASYAFDASVKGLTQLFMGRSLVIVSEEEKRDVSLLKARIELSNIGLLDCTPSLVELWFLEEEGGYLPGLVIGGESISVGLWDRLVAHQLATGHKVFNVYGPTECTVDSHWIEVSGNRPRLGKAIPNVVSYVLDKHQGLVPQGSVGELYIGGLGLARGYWGQPELTEERFVANPFSDEVGSRLYRTGDLVRWLDSGDLEFVGRIDDQVKLRGFRIELGEIERHLLSCSGVVNGVVVLSGEGAEDKRLVAYMVVEGEQEEGEFIERVRELLLAELPDYMVPSLYVVLEEIPLTVNGKVDRGSLPDPDMSVLGEEYVEPRTDTERALAEIWGELLGIESGLISATANFFTLGGHSLLAVRLVAAVRLQMRREIPVKAVFERSDLRGLALRIEADSDVSLREEIVRVDRTRESYPLSFAQQRLWFIDRMESGSPEYNMPVALRLEGEFDVRCAEASLRSLISRHEPLRTVFFEGESEPYQIIREGEEFSLVEHDLSDLEGEERDLRLFSLIDSDSRGVFDLSKDLMLRASYIRLGRLEGVLLFNMHHIASDGWSMGVIIDEFVQEYGSRLLGESYTAPELAIQYVDYAHWQREWLQGEVLESHIDYWKGCLLGLPEVHNLPLDYARAEVQDHRGGVYRQDLGVEIQQGLNELAQRHGATLFMVLHAAFTVLLSRHSGEDDIVMGTPVANRDQAELSPLVGFFVNTLVLRLDVSDNPSFEELLIRGKDYLLGAYDHQQLPFERLVDELSPERSLSYSPLFQVMLTLQNNERRDLSLPGLRISGMGESHAVSKYDLSLTVVEGEEGLHVSWIYAEGLFKGSTIERMGCRFKELLVGVLSDPGRRIGELEVLPGWERERLLLEWNDTGVAYPEDVLIHELFEDQVELRGEAVALVCGEESLSYRELNERSNGLARYLRELGVGLESLVGLCVERSVEMVVGVLGILKAGGAYVPIDPGYPGSRQSYMVSDTGIDLLLTQRGLRGLLGDFAGVEVVDLDGEWLGGCVENLGRLAGQGSSNLAYVMYTSGSTGKPKGVMIEHKGVVNLSQWHVISHHVDNNSVCTMLASIGFDASVWELWPYLAVGAKIVMVSDEQRLLFTELLNIIIVHQVTHCFLPVALLHCYLDKLSEAENFLQYVFTGGDRLQAHRKRGAFSVMNCYGPTETTVVASSCLVTGDYTNPPPIGRPISNVYIYVLDKHQGLVPQGSVGELYIGGLGLARGYWGQPELTEERFVANPFSDEVGSRLYRTGDLVRWLDSGDLEFVGRIDDQVKLRGFRIELGEIERHLLSCSGVVNGVVVLSGEGAEDKRLVAYMVVEGEQEEGEFIERVRELLLAELPDYMVPSLYMVLEEIPLTVNGKVDRGSLPDPDMSVLGEEYVEPRTDTERALAEIWGELLGIESGLISATANFFTLGGHSLLAVRLVAAVRLQMRREIPVKAVFERSDLRGLALRIEADSDVSLREEIVRVDRTRESYPLSFAQQRLWFIDRMESGSPEYNMPVALRLEGEFDVRCAEASLRSLISRHEPLRTVFFEGESEPYQIIREGEEFSLVEHDLSDLEGEERDLRLFSLIDSDSRGVFDLSKDLMLRASYIRLGRLEGVLLFNMHHIASDGWSMGVIIDEFVQEYGSRLLGESYTAPELAIQYVDYAHWQREWLQGEVLESHIDYWKGCLLGLPEVHNLPLDYARAEVQDHRGGVYRQDLGVEIQQGLNELAQRHGATLFMVLHAAFTVLLSRHSGEDDIVMGTPVANRDQAELSPLVGFFVNTLVLRLDVSDNPSFEELLIRGKDYLLGAYDHQQLPFERLVDELSPERSLSYSPLFQVMLTLQNNERRDLSLPGLRISGMGESHAVARYDLAFNINEGDDGLHVSWIYAEGLFKGSTIERMGCRFKELLVGVLSDPGRRIGELEVLPGWERERLLLEWNDTGVAYPEDVLIHELFEDQVELRGEAVALVCGEESLSYRELNERSNGLARYLRELGVGLESLVGLCVERSMEMVVGVLGILKAGGAYVPIDPGYPGSRQSYMVSDTGIDLLLTQRGLRGLLGDFAGVEVVDLDGEWLGGCVENLGRLAGQGSSNLAYVMYTSGSTGKPKGVMIEHRCLLNLGKNINALELFSSDSMSWGWVASYAFDASLQGLTQLFMGRSLVIVSEEEKRDVSLLKARIELSNIGLLDCTPSLVELWFLEEEGGYLPGLVIGGESISVGLWDRLVAHQLATGHKVFNVYGPTECTVDSHWIEVSGNRPRLGKAIPNVVSYVLDKHQGLVPQGSVGELYIGGLGLARGYWGQPELTEERFVANPFSDEVGSRLYRTGDLVRWLDSGDLEFVGRIDDQVKLRGFRIELGEIERHLLSCSGVVNGVVVLSGEGAEDKRLVAYMVVEGEQEEGEFIERVRELLLAELPDYMVPSLYVVLEEIPLTVNGKVDRGSLPDPDMSVLGEEYVEPRTDTERALAEIWGELLGIESGLISATANFFTLGGHSLLVLRMVNMVKKSYARNIPVLEVFSNPTIREISKLITSEAGLDTINRSDILITLNEPTTKAETIYCIPGAGAPAFSFANMSAQANTDFTIKAYNYQGLFNNFEPHESVEEIAEHFLNILPKERAEQVYMLAGHSFGGLVAYEMAKKISAKGDCVRLILLDCMLLGDDGGGSGQTVSPSDENLNNLGGFYKSMDPELMEKIFYVYNLQVVMAKKYTAKHEINGPIYNFYAENSTRWMKRHQYERLLERLTQLGVYNHMVRGNHYSMLTGFSAKEILTTIRYLSKEN